MLGTDTEIFMLLTYRYFAPAYRPLIFWVVYWSHCTIMSMSVGVSDWLQQIKHAEWMFMCFHWAVLSGRKLILNWSSNWVMHEGQYPAECFSSVTLTQPTYTMATITTIQVSSTHLLSHWYYIRTFHKHKIEDMSQKTKQMNSAQILQNLFIFLVK